MPLLPSLQRPPSPRIVVYVALLGNIAVAITKLAAAVITGSAAMFSEAVHSFVDCGNEGLLLYGYRRAARRPDLIHPMGYGRELYFWSFIVALQLFALGAGVSLRQGVRQVVVPHPIEYVSVNYVVLGFSFLFESVSWIVAWRAFAKLRGGVRFWTAFRQSKDPPTFMVLFEDSAALIGMMIAAVGIFTANVLDMPRLDGVASILIGLVLAIVAILLAIESKGLLIGERATPALVDSICRIAQDQPGVVHANSALTAQLAPHQAMVALSIEFDKALCAEQIEACVASIERRVKLVHPDVVALFVKPQTFEQFERARKKWFDDYAIPTM
ncbi:cation diffusion facilitator family transporter [Bradyrhizobium pachyrhizi]|uniref:Cation diffusion facilitator family transporter n=1 Tax=Bradyrhizobium pachyrhizi TaxID=280333 RepID=A0A844SH60_9BRAD|nr:cation diffusion facilitator family transporter [Bradyrhizobium pachyrhizi]MVT64906.1 cation diffusion facilitator family transporter [Bradyrhizobium pachyrhizi]